ncbi:MAG: LytTR family transcriptional regulator DNA-binding domain-containing protein [Lachnospiraceae bacterium]|nr:LytTR family transcriptional regulator DNA-binding domain-containing protein [Lachnospiraceae bacterium]
MKIQYQNDPSLKEDYIEVHFREETERIKTIRDFFDAFQSITGKKENDIYKLHPESIYYLEVVDRKLFAYQEKEVYQLEYSLQHFLECFENSGFVRIGKSTAVNLYKVNQVKADFNMRLRLVMDNGEILILNRTYKKSFLGALHHIREVCYENH